MPDSVVDTNVWANVDKNPDNLTATELKCVQRCFDWLRAFVDSTDHLVLDDMQRILREYRRNMPKDGVGFSWLRRLETAPREKRLIELAIEWDDTENCAKVPASLAPLKNDRTFVAVALKHEPRPPIVASTDTDWTKAKKDLDALKIVVEELCPDYIQEKLEGQKPPKP